MKRLILPAILALSTSVLFAQQPTAPTDATQPAPHRHHAPDPAKETARLTQALNLTPDQAAKVEPILADRQQKVAAIMADTTLTDDARQAQMKAIHKNSEKQIHGILTPDQLAQMKAMHHGHEGAPEGQPLTPPAA